MVQPIEHKMDGREYSIDETARCILQAYAA